MTSPSKKSPIIFISYFVGIKGNCPAEWADDKIRVLEHEHRELLIITGMQSDIRNNPTSIYFRVPSLSWHNFFKDELKDLKKKNKPIPFAMYAFALPVVLLGLPIDFIIRKTAKSITAGYWSWIITSLPLIIWLRFRYGAKTIFTTGGPSSAHVIGTLAAKLTNAHLFCEFQDPLVGNSMKTSSRSISIAIWLESWFVKQAKKVIYVTKVAAESARRRNPLYASRIKAVYPGAWKFFKSSNHQNRQHNKNLEFLHLGTLYGTRNLDLFLKAIDQLREEDFSLAHLVRVVNLGAVYCENIEDYLNRDDFILLDALDRVDALKRAQNASCLLLVQHTDERSKETIPYKTYDYFNLQLPVLGILNNNELGELIESNAGFVSRANSCESIKEALKQCLEASISTEIKTGESIPRIDISPQFLSVIDQID